ncbi:MAG TPA: hypothetical protein VMS54_04945 [Vicinamibacterales bacterium]|nr:hypothetical protein [Vicinamibacterales bacterium]
MAHTSSIDLFERPPDPMIPGIYNYCDRWCERCVFSARCRVFRDMRLMEHALERGQDPVQALSVLAEAEYKEAERERSPAERAEWEDMLARASAILADLDLGDADAQLKRRDAWIEAQPVNRTSHEYGRLAMDVCVPLQQMLPSGSDGARPAIDTVLHLAALIPAKVFRALTGLPAGGAVDEDWDADRLEDANGSAKVVRLAIAESLEAWAALADLPALAGVPASMISRLGEMDAELARLFPGALAFVRPGFDDGGACVWE